MPLAAVPGDEPAAHTHVSLNKLQRLIGWDHTALRQLWEGGAFPKPLDPSAAKPVWSAHLIFDWLHVNSERQAEAARYIREHHADAYERSFRRSKADWRDDEKEEDAFITTVEAHLKALEEGIELIPRLRSRPPVSEEDDEDDGWALLLRHWQVATFIPFQVATLKVNRAQDDVEELRESSGELVVKGSSFQFALEQLHTAAVEYRSASNALRHELSHLHALSDVAASVFSVARRKRKGQPKRVSLYYERE